jgi:hypothetical protein
MSELSRLGSGPARPRKNRPQRGLNVSRPARAIADHLAICGNEEAGPTLAHPQDITQINDSFTLGGGPYHFFVRSSFSALMESLVAGNSAIGHETSDSVK